VNVRKYYIHGHLRFIHGHSRSVADKKEFSMNNLG